MSLIEYHQEYLQILEQIESMGGELSPENEEKLATIVHEISRHADKADFVLRKLDSESDFIDAEIKRLQAFKRAVDNANTRMRDFIKMQMKALSVTKIEGKYVNLNLSKTKPRVVVDETFVDPAYFDEVVTKKLNKERISEDLKLGPVPGAHFEDVYTLRITRSKNGV